LKCGGQIRSGGAVARKSGLVDKAATIFSPIWRATGCDPACDRTMV